MNYFVGRLIPDDDEHLLTLPYSLDPPGFAPGANDAEHLVVN